MLSGNQAIYSQSTVLFCSVLFWSGAYNTRWRQTSCFSVLKRKAVQVRRSPVVFMTGLTGFRGCNAIAGDVYNKSHRSSPVQRLSLAGSARWAELRPGAEVRRAACRCNTQAGRHRCYRCHRCAGALSAITGWLRAVGRTSARHGKVRRAACRCNTQAGRHRCHRCCRCHR
jgi:hypothetical protein